MNERKLSYLLPTADEKMDSHYFSHHRITTYSMNALQYAQGIARVH